MSAQAILEYHNFRIPEPSDNKIQTVPLQGSVHLRGTNTLNEVVK